MPGLPAAAPRPLRKSRLAWIWYLACQSCYDLDSARLLFESSISGIELSRKPLFEFPPWPPHAGSTETILKVAMRRCRPVAEHVWLFENGSLKEMGFC